MAAKMLARSFWDAASTSVSDHILSQPGFPSVGTMSIERPNVR